MGTAGRWRKLEQGQGLVEYALILVLVSVVVLVVLAVLGPTIGNLFSGVVCNLRNPTSTTCFAAAVVSYADPIDAQEAYCHDLQDSAPVYLFGNSGAHTYAAAGSAAVPGSGWALLASNTCAPFN